MKKIILILGLVFFLNFLWEISQSFLYAPHFIGFDGLLKVHLIASAGDLVLVLLTLAPVFFLARFSKKTLSTPQEILLVAFFGFVLAIIVEKYALATQRWEYLDLMPLIPFLKVGLLPILQMLLIPNLIWAFWTKNSTKRNFLKIFFVSFASIELLLGVLSWKFFQEKDLLPSDNLSEKTFIQNGTPLPARISETAAPQKITQKEIFGPPLEQAGERIIKKPFGILIDRQTSPVQPERFSGYHAGTDFEIFPEELDEPVEVRAVCTGTLLKKEFVGGYGGVAVQSCDLNGQPVTVVYGHLKLASILQKVGDKISIGETIGVLGKDKSTETDGERKHLHLSIYKNATVNLRGYVATKNELSSWLDPCEYICQ